ncbi:Uncharacterised protein [uncultured archaeon]|nr:Uncharacterised protein [uncultured archaeon]
MSKDSLFSFTWKAYSENFWLILLMAIPGLLALIIPIAVGTPAFIALGGAYLRTNSIPDLGPAQAALMIAAAILSVFLMSFAIVSINLVIKRERTLSHVRAEILSSLGTTTLSIFWVYLLATLLLLIVQLYSFEYGVQALLAPLINLVIGVVILLIPTSMVMDEVRPWRAFERSIDTVLRKLPLIGLWLLTGLFILSIFELPLLWLSDPAGGLLAFLRPVVPSIILLFNSLILMPFLIVMLGQIYISKYTIIAKS